MVIGTPVLAYEQWTRFADRPRFPDEGRTPDEATVDREGLLVAARRSRRTRGRQDR
ncbi:hypothetical protein Pd630_LPD09123 (plasmid) [Rhodococcus opacus PD630]|nr:hypothetical protein Pd630_LPD09123 [Rhodococcus opacus PD630]